MARKQGAMVMMVLMWLFPLVYGTDLQCVYCPGLFGVYSCTRINNRPITTCVRIKPMAKEPIREIRLFSCAVRIVVGWDGQQQPFMIRDRDGNICNPATRPVPSTSRTKATTPVPSTSRTKATTPVPSTSRTKATTPVPSTSRTKATTPVPSTSRTKATTPVPSTSRTKATTPVPSTSRTKATTPVPSTSRTKATTPVPSTSRTKATTPVPSTTHVPSTSRTKATRPVPSTSRTKATTPHDDDDLFDRPTESGFLAWSITSTLTIIIYLLKRYLRKRFCMSCSCTHTRNSSDTPDTHEHIPLPDLSALPPMDAAPDASHGVNQPSQSTPDTSNYNTPQSSTKKLLCDAPAYNTRSKGKGKVLFE